MVSANGTELTRVTLPVRPADGCAYRLAVADGRWSLDGGSLSQPRRGSVEMPVVSALFSSLDLARGAAPSIAVGTTVYGSRATIVQTVVRALGALAALAALLLVARPSARAPRSRAGLRRAFRSVRVVDGVVVAVLLGWWVLGPAVFDDGWVTAGQENFSATGDLSSYYDSFAVTTSLQYWLAWVEHWLFESSDALLVLRIPALVCLTGTWLLCRWIFGRLTRPAVAARAVEWALAAGFLTGALAWGMTLRPEPVIALLVTGVLACTVLFAQSEEAAPLAVAAVLIALALSAHPAGLVALAPLIAISPSVLRWARPRLATVVTIVVASAALLAILALLGSDLAHFRANAASLRAFGVENAGWRDELTRYSLLSRDLYGAPLRRLWVALAILAVFAYLLRGARGRVPSLLNLSAPALGISLLLLIVTPAKLPWHFGALLGVGAVALASETARLLEQRKAGWHARPFIVIGAAMVAAAWVWSPRKTWSDLDLRTLHWTLGIERRITLAKAAGVAPILVLCALAALELARRRRSRRLADVPWRVAVWTVPLVALPLIAFTIGILAGDAFETSSWTLTRQNLQTLGGRLRCGLADDALVPSLRSMRSLQRLGPSGVAPSPDWLPPSPVPGVDAFALEPQAAEQPTRSPWFELRPGERIGFFLTGVAAPAESTWLEWGRRDGARVRAIRSDQVATNLASDARPELAYWRFYAAGDLSGPPDGASAVRLSSRTAGFPGPGIAVTAPVSYTDDSLSSMLDTNSPALVLPNLLTYLPCTELPPVRSGVAQVPGVIVAFRDTTWPLGSGTSPFDQLPDLYPLVRLPLSDSPDPPGEIAVYEVDRHIDGAAVLPPSSSVTH
jgi:hypothetical protein